MEDYERDLEQLLDNCLEEVADGKLPSDVLAARREQADAIRPLLEVAHLVRGTVPPPRRMAVNKVAFLAAVEARRAASGTVVEARRSPPSERFRAFVSHDTCRPQPSYLSYGHG